MGTLVEAQGGLLDGGDELGEAFALVDVVDAARLILTLAAMLLILVSER